ncbi:MAG: MBL fold metallo-hydrolase [Saprospiraceae bacterium]
MIPAYQKDEVFLADVRAQRQRPGLQLWWLGQSGYLIHHQNHHMLIDPYLSDSLTHKYAHTDKPHIRMSERVVAPEKLDFIDLVTSSHNHTDHLDADTLKPIIAANPSLHMLVPEANRLFVADRLSVNRSWPIGISDGQQYSLPWGWVVHGIPAAHNDLERDENGNCRYLGYVFNIGPWTIYHSGDTLWHPEIIDALQSFQIDIALLPINGNLPERRVAGNLNAREAVGLAKSIGAKLLVPGHYHMFTFNSVEPEECLSISRQADQPTHLLQLGERLDWL